MEVISKRYCGLDVHKEMVVACVMIREGGEAHKEIRTFRTMTSDLLVLYDWSLAHRVTHVAMESTGVYWKPIFNLLEGSFEVLLVNAAHIKAVPGRKTDVKDCEWIADLLSHRLLKGSFIPPEPMRDLRDLTRYRKSLIDERIREINRLQKLLESANIKLSSVASDILGVSAKAMLEALVSGNTDPEVLTDLARGKLRKKLSLLRETLEGRFRPHHQFMLGQILSHLDFLDEAIEQISKEVENRMVPFLKEIELLKRILRVDQKTAELIVAEIGVDMNRFPTHPHLASWAGLCPGNNESAGKRKSGKTRKGDRWLKRGLMESSWAVGRTNDTYFSALYHRMARRRGKKKAVVAVAHTTLVIIYYMLKHKLPYRELGPD
ncbi:MAG: IS110 family transposase [Deltaproteobacteria bacterium]